MSSHVKFYAQEACMKGINISGPGMHIFDSNLRYASVEASFFIKATFCNCDLSYTEFNNVSFKNGYLYRLTTELTRFESCDFTNTCMNDFTFNRCTFIGCDFTRCDMKYITFKDCIFIDCNFKNAELPPFFYPSQMSNCKNVPYMPMACPEEGEIIGYKIAAENQIKRAYPFTLGYENMARPNVLVTLLIPADAKRSSAGGRKCRCDKAEVIGLEHVDTHENLSIAYSKYDIRFKYRIGEKISVPNFNENRWDECSSGIHFFINRKEALQYYGLMEAYYAENV